MSDKLIHFIGLPTRQFVVQALTPALNINDLKRFHWIRVPAQIATLSRDAKIYMLPGAENQLGSEEHRNLERAIRARGIALVEASPAAMKQLIRGGQ